MQQLANNMVLELSATKAKASSKGDGDDSMEKIDKVGFEEGRKGKKVVGKWIQGTRGHFILL
eukprot:1150286-Pelagomonas_calceolata.AAC.9